MNGDRIEANLQVVHPDRFDIDPIISTILSRSVLRIDVKKEQRKR